MKYSSFNNNIADWSKLYTYLTEKSSMPIIEWLIATSNPNSTNYMLLSSRIARKYGRYEELKSKPKHGMYFNRPRNSETFFMPTQRNKPGKGTPRYEPWIAKLMLREEFNLGSAGIVKNVEVPYYSTKQAKDGNIDLISFNKDNNSLYLLELKADQSHESLVRCILEPYTYLKRITKQSLERLKIEFGGDADTRIVICPLLFNSKACNPFIEWKNRNDTFFKFEELVNNDLTLFLETPGPHLDYVILDTQRNKKLLCEARCKANFAARAESAIQ